VQFYESFRLSFAAEILKISCI